MPVKRSNTSGQAATSLGRGVGLLLTALLAMALVTAVLAWRAEQAEAQIQRHVDINAALRAYHGLLSELLNAETGQRGYLLTGRAIYLEPYLSAVQNVQTRLTEVQALAASATERAPLQRLRELCGLKLAELARTIALYDAGRPAESQALLLSDQGQQHMTALRVLITDTMVQLRTERDALAVQLTLDAGRTRLWLLIGLSLLTGFSALALWQVHSSGRQLRGAEQRMRSIADNVPALITQFDRERRLVFANAHVATVYGLAPQQVLGKTIADVRGEAAAAEVRPHMDRVMQGERVAFESSSLIADRLRHFQQNYVPDIDADGEVRGFYSISIDISERKASEACIAASEQGMRAIADNLPVLITYLDANLRLRFVNETFREWLGLDPAAVLGQRLADVIGPELFAQRGSQLQRALAGERIQFELCSTALGQVRHLQNIYIPDVRPDGQVLGLYTLSTDITTMKLTELQLGELARCDALTSLPNRRQFDERLTLALARSRRDGSMLALFFLDIDRFKAINDGHGHGIGDAVLKIFAQRLLACVRSTDLAARLAGDEFVLILEGLDDAAAASAVAEKILRAMSVNMVVEGQLSLQVGSSIGVALLRADADSKAQPLLDRADRALYRAKREGRGCYVVDAVLGDVSAGP